MTDTAPMNSEDTKKILGEKLNLVSTGPGVYRMKDKEEKIIYVGKAKNLRKRLISYFRREEYTDIKTGILVKKIAGFDTVVTKTEQEALILEATLIRKHKPRYNVILKDDKRYPSLRIDIREDFPTVTIHRKVTRDGALYFGPYSSASAVHQTLKIINKTFKIRKCTTTKFKNRSRPCLNYQIGLCLGPCCNKIDRETYHQVIKEVTLFLRGRTPELISGLKKEMAAHAENERFEEAARCRDKIIALEAIVEKQAVVSTDMVDRDIVTVTRGKTLSLVTILSLTGGVLSGSRHFPFTETIADDTGVVETFIRQHYENAPNIPKEILTPFPPEDPAVLEEWLSGLKKARVKVFRPMRGDKVRLVEMGIENGKKELEERESQGRLYMALLIRLRNLLKMESIPEHIECFDNSNISGTDPVAAMVVFRQGVPFKSGYRKYKIQNSEIQDDYAYMAEILERRYSKEEGGFPDLLVVDGGKGQLNIAVDVIQKLGLSGRFTLIGIAKKDEEKGEEYDKIYLPGRANPVSFGKQVDALHLLQRVRDEAHRFAISFHRKRRDKRTTASLLDSIPGIGEKRKKTLLMHFGSVKAMQNASLEDLKEAGMPGAVAETLLDALKKGDG